MEGSNDSTYGGVGRTIYDHAGYMDEEFDWINVGGNDTEEKIIGGKWG